MKIRKSCSQTLNSWVVSYKNLVLRSFMNCYTRFWNYYPRIGKRFHIRDLDAWQRGWILTGSHFSRSSFTFVEVKVTINVWNIPLLLVQSHMETYIFLKGSSESDFLNQKFWVRNLSKIIALKETRDKSYAQQLIRLWVSVRFT